ncbi:MAG TPA: NUDIX hydrolase [Symbiobacteriaceae bacterium]|nr:NUDIX hydrolase [Symbiobacteriaceae bacterium]
MSWLRWAERIQAIAQIGLTYTRDPYDAERYHQLRDLAVEITASQSGMSAEQAREMIAVETGYATPKVDVRAAVFQDGKLLMVRERSDGCWALPGGWADVGDSPGEMAAREVREESGYIVRPVKVLAVLDRSRHGLTPMIWSVYTIFLQCELISGSPTDTLETYGVGFFGRDELPPLSVQRNSPSQIARLFAHYDNPDLPTDFD